MGVCSKRRRRRGICRIMRRLVAMSGIPIRRRILRRRCCWRRTGGRRISRVIVRFLFPRLLFLSVLTFLSRRRSASTLTLLHSSIPFSLPPSSSFPPLFTSSPPLSPSPPPTFAYPQPHLRIYLDPHPPQLIFVVALVIAVRFVLSCDRREKRVKREKSERRLSAAILSKRGCSGEEERSRRERFGGKLKREKSNSRDCFVSTSCRASVLPAPLDSVR